MTKGGDDKALYGNKILLLKIIIEGVKLTIILKYNLNNS